MIENDRSTTTNIKKNQWMTEEMLELMQERRLYQKYKENHKKNN